MGFDTFYGVEEAIKKKPFIYRLGKKISDTANSERLNEWILSPIQDILRNRSSEGSTIYQPSHSDEDTVDQALDFINYNQNTSNDFFCWIHFMDAHTPYEFWPKHLKEIRGNTNIEHTTHPGDEGKITVGEEPPEDVIDTYDACVRSVDEQIGRVLSAIRQDTIVILTGDHGEEFGRYNSFHAPSLYSSMTQVPIIIRAPSIPTGINKTPVQHLDLPPTILAAADISVPDYFEGEALQTMNRKPDHPIFFTLSKDNIQSEEKMAVRRGEWKLIEADGSPELYRVHHSERETDMNAKQHENIAKELQEFLESHRKKPIIGKGKHILSNDKDQLSDEIEENLEDLGYL